VALLPDDVTLDTIDSFCPACRGGGKAEFRPAGDECIMSLGPFTWTVSK
jgi:hypothetical protein